MRVSVTAQRLPMEGRQRVVEGIPMADDAGPWMC
ncbi:hypothetical protein FHR33_000526 [Nonomuraea dietziae]|jgi:hypothetical protein|uniref:Uncharacterized protein n=1 Tax=Nonomuraea dietziae TaxID=65515 RepID=A0A7W5UU69_9ACTN|nr:hypothetical protein [Nonomuraea dietziae]